jgi:hypothetical protein
MQRKASIRSPGSSMELGRRAHGAIDAERDRQDDGSGRRHSHSRRSSTRHAQRYASALRAATARAAAAAGRR